MKEGTIQHEYHGGWFFDFSKIDKNITGMNSGILLFKPSRSICRVFSEINQHIKSMKDAGKKLPRCLDQPFLNYHAIKNDRHETGFLEKYGLIYCYEPPPPPSAPTDIIMCHFVWPIGNANHKKNRMVKHLTHILNHYTVLKGGLFVEPNISEAIYNWGTHGSLKFKENGLIETTWGKGKYKWLDINTVEVSWSRYSHVLRMNSDYTKFLGVRLGDIITIEGERRKKNLVYMCVFHNKAYIDLLRILMTSITFYSKTDDIDFLVFTSEEFKPLVDSLSGLLEIPIKTKIFQFTTINESMCARLFIFDYKDIDLYEKVLYLDTDIVVQNDLSVLFDQDIGDRVYGVKEGVIGHEHFGGWFFDFSKFDKDAAAMNSGILFFRPSSAIRSCFGGAIAHIAKMKDMPYCIMISRRHRLSRLLM
jgi:hypothetical protein